MQAPDFKEDKEKEPPLLDIGVQGWSIEKDGKSLILQGGGGVGARNGCP